MNLISILAFAAALNTSVSCTDKLPVSPENPSEPPAEEIIIKAPEEAELLRTYHPRLIMNDEELKELRKMIDRKDNKYLMGLHNACMKFADDALVASTLKYEKDASNTRILYVSRDALLRIFSEAYAYRVTGEEKYLVHAEQDILDVCAFPDWNPSHYLDVAEMSTAVALGYDWLFNNLKPETRSTVVKTLNNYAFATSLNSEWAWFYTAAQNWNQVCNSGLVCAALATFESNPNVSRHILSEAVKTNVESQEVGYSPDGNFPEGPGYWAYGTIYEVLMIDNMEKCVGSDYGLGKIKGFDKTSQYILYTTGTTNMRFNYYDNGTWDVSSKVDFHQSGTEKGTRERVRSKVTKFGYHYKFLSSF